VLPGYARLDLSAKYVLTSSTELFGRIDNLTNAQYQDPAGFNAPGISAYVGVRWSR
jgi:vitamin B12 transporter